jgi:hypothetical protein
MPKASRPTVSANLFLVDPAATVLPIVHRHGAQSSIGVEARPERPALNYLLELRTRNREISPKVAARYIVLEIAMWIFAIDYSLQGGHFPCG